MLVIKVWGIPQETEEHLQNMADLLIQAASKCPGLTTMKYELNGRAVVFFPSDLMKAGLGEEIFIEVVPDLPLGLTGRNDLAAKVAMVINSRFRAAKIRCQVYRYEPGDGVWSI